MKRSLLLAICNIALLIGIFLAAASLLERYSDQPIFSRDLDEFPWFTLIVAQTGMLFWSGYCWSRLLGAFAGQRISIAVGIEQTALMQISKYVPGKVWGIAIRAITIERHGVKPATAVEASLHEQYISLFTSCWFGASLYATQANEIAATILLVIGIPIGWWFMKNGNALYARTRGIIPILPEIKTTEQIDKKKYFLSLANYAALWIFIATISYLLLSPLGISPTPSELLLITASLMVSVAVGFLALFAPGGIGVREATLTAMMTPIVGYEIALAFAICYRLWNTFFDIASALIGFVIYFFTKSRAIEPKT